jgi:hypothetical protein
MTRLVRRVPYLSSVTVEATNRIAVTVRRSDVVSVL